jgi:hypothetical protein
MVLVYIIDIDYCICVCYTKSFHGRRPCARARARALEARARARALEARARARARALAGWQHPRHYDTTLLEATTRVRVHTLLTLLADASAWPWMALALPPGTPHTAAHTFAHILHARPPPRCRLPCAAARAAPPRRWRAAPRKRKRRPPPTHPPARNCAPNAARDAAYRIFIGAHARARALEHRLERATRHSTHSPNARAQAPQRSLTPSALPQESAGHVFASKGVNS